MRYMALALALILACSCASSPGEVAQKIKYDFGIGEKPEGYESPSDKVMAQLDKVAKTEMKRLNLDGRQGKVHFQEETGLLGKFYKEAKVYEDYYPLEARVASRSAGGSRGYIGYIDYTYRVFQSERKTNRTEAAAASASIGTDDRGREQYRYTFSTGGVWDGRKGELVQR